MSVHTIGSEQEENSNHARLSYKFQRLRERLRQAVQTGELAGKLPGERELARQFKANPKTLSKALSDLAGEGLLERSIGRGTYVTGSAPARRQEREKWLVICEPGGLESPLACRIAAANANTVVVAAGSKMRPSFLSQFRVAIDLTEGGGDSLHRDMLIRGIFVLSLGREPRALRVHGAALDKVHAASLLARDLLLAGHRRIRVLEPVGSGQLLAAVRITAGRYAPHAAVSAASLEDIGEFADRHAAILCDGEQTAASALQLMHQNHHALRVSLAAVGTCDTTPCCSGIFVTSEELAQVAMALLKDGQAHRPTTLWLTGTHIDRGTIFPHPTPFLAAESGRYAILSA